MKHIPWIGLLLVTGTLAGSRMLADDREGEKKHSDVKQRPAIPGYGEPIAIRAANECEWGSHEAVDLTNTFSAFGCTRASAKRSLFDRITREIERKRTIKCHTRACDATSECHVMYSFGEEERIERRIETRRVRMPGCDDDMGWYAYAVMGLPTTNLWGELFPTRIRTQCICVPKFL